MTDFILGLPYFLSNVGRNKNLIQLIYPHIVTKYLESNLQLSLTDLGFLPQVLSLVRRASAFPKKKCMFHKPIVLSTLGVTCHFVPLSFISEVAMGY